MRSPDFWFTDPKRPGWRARVLAPLAALAARATGRRLARGAEVRPGCPVICVGNLNLGGTGKTPAVIATVRRLAERGVAAHVLTRGYGGRMEGPVRVDPARHNAADVGDEALLHAAFAPTWVARDRAAGARAAEAAGAPVIVMDDGHQNPAVARDLSLVVVDAAKGFGNGRVAPAGPLREPVRVGLARADAVLSIGSQRDQEQFEARWPLELPHLTGHLAPLPTGMDWAGLRVLAFAGIGDPARFFATLDDLGAQRVGSVALDDHQPIGGAMFSRLETQAAKLSAQLVTTEKDAVRLPPDARAKVLVVPVRLELSDWSAFDDMLAKVGL